MITHLEAQHVRGFAGILVVAAWAPELQALHEGAPSRGPKTDTVGVGLVEAAAGAARAIARHRPAAVVLIGTAGVFASVKRRYPLDSVVVARRIHLASSAVARGTGYLPRPMPAVAVSDTALRRTLVRAGAVAADVACPLAITRATTEARRVSRATDAHVENLEAFAVARAAAAVDLPFAAVLGITNVVGPDAHAQWRAHAAPAAAAACALVLACLRTR